MKKWLTTILVIAITALLLGYALASVDLAALVNGSPEFKDRKPYRPIWNAVKLAADKMGSPPGK